MVSLGWRGICVTRFGCTVHGGWLLVVVCFCFGGFRLLFGCLCRVVALVDCLACWVWWLCNIGLARVFVYLVLGLVVAILVLACWLFSDAPFDLGLLAGYMVFWLLVIIVMRWCGVFGYLCVFADCVLGILETFGLGCIADAAGFCCIEVGLHTIGLCADFGLFGCGLARCFVCGLVRCLGWCLDLWFLWCLCSDLLASCLSSSGVSVVCAVSGVLVLVLVLRVVGGFLDDSGWVFWACGFGWLFGFSVGSV